MRWSGSARKLGYQTHYVIDGGKARIVLSVDAHIDLVRAYMETKPYLKAIRKRKVWIEPLFAEGKLWHGMRRFRTRTLEKTNAEALLIAAGQNVKRLLAFAAGGGPKKLAQAAALRPPSGPLSDLARRWRGVHRRKRGFSPEFFNKQERIRKGRGHNTPAL